MPTTLCLDFGNTRLKAAVFHNGSLGEIFMLESDPVADLAVIIEKHHPRFSILSSVVTHPIEIERLLEQKTIFHKLSHTSLLPFTIPVGKPETVGTDRIAIAAAVVDLFAGKNNLAIALGTCITYNFINRNHQLIGGSISPGMEMRFKSLNQFTAKLPLVKGDWNVPLVGWDTATNIQSGVVLGMAKEIDGIVSAYEKQYGNFNAVLTGGDIPFLAPHLKKEIFADPDLIFKGLYAISKLNHA
ncbi:MAG TPA: type III pantothenate kinase [Flavisolibacter sp.]|jgi:type III pantothenate kinase